MKNNITMSVLHNKADVIAGYFDTCVLCRKNTKVLKITPVHLRHFYVESAGQLCCKCWNIYIKTNLFTFFQNMIYYQYENISTQVARIWP